ncbi:MAG: hypothetical protein IJ777_02175 [Clostridia bacterium]|nr:hypothetical protein [Clostridia bacterium]
MKTVGFIGAYDKIDLILYLARTLVATGQKVLVVDTTVLQKAKYIVPAINPTRSYVTDFEGIDVAIGFSDYNSIKEYLGMPGHAAFSYDYALLDVDTTEMLENFDVKANDRNYFVTGMDLYSLKRGLEILSSLTEPISLTKVMFSKQILKEEDEYLNYLSLGYKIQWSDEIIYFPFETGDQTTILENQRISKIRLRKLTELYKESLLYLAQELLGNATTEADLRKAFKQLEKGV